MNGIWTDNIDNYEDWEDMTAFADHLPCIWTGGANDDEMTDADWEEYSREFEARYNEHLRSIKSSSPRRVRGSRAKCNLYDDYSEGSYDDGDALEKCYFEEYGIGSLFPPQKNQNIIVAPSVAMRSTIQSKHFILCADPMKIQWQSTFWKASGDENLTFSEIYYIIYM